MTNIKLSLLFKKKWMRFWQLFRMIISLIAMSIIYFALITPYAVVMRMTGRDMLRLQRVHKKSYWITRSQKIPQTDFTKQY
jgi:hypothetical protein